MKLEKHQDGWIVQAHTSQEYTHLEYILEALAAATHCMANTQEDSSQANHSPVRHTEEKCSK